MRHCCKHIVYGGISIKMAWKRNVTLTERWGRAHEDGLPPAAPSGGGNSLQPLRPLDVPLELQ